MTTNPHNEAAHKPTEVNSALAQEQSWVKRHAMALSLGVLGVGTAVAIATNPIGELEKTATDVAPWVGGGIVGTEILWEAGAGMMLAGAGRKVGNPLKLKGRWNEVAENSVNSRLFRAGLAINTAGAVGLSGVLAAGASQMPAETWPGAAALITADLAGTIALRAPLVKAMRSHKVSENMATPEKAKKPTIRVRHARPEDIDRLADIDILLFDKAYGEKKPVKEEVVEMLTRRYNNNPDWMYVSEVNGEVDGFVSAFRTNKPIDEFVSWEDSTADGTLDGKIDPKGKYVYVTNMTIKHEAVELGAEDMLLANLFANGIAGGVEYGYFVARMPYFKRWAESQGIETENNPNIEQVANEYFQLRNKDGKLFDKQLAMYESFSKLTRLVGGGFDDEASLGFGVVCRADCPPYKDALRHQPILWLTSKALRQVAKYPKVLEKVL